MFDKIPAKYAVYTPYIYGSGQPYKHAAVYVVYIRFWPTLLKWVRRRTATLYPPQNFMTQNTDFSAFALQCFHASNSKRRPPVCDSIPLRSFTLSTSRKLCA